MITIKMLLNKFFFYPAPVIVYTGIPESGKTDNAIWLTQKGLEYGFIDMCATNMHVIDDRFLQLTSLRSLEKWLALFRSKRKMVILDEADSCMTNLDTVSKLSKEFRVPMAFQIRKYHAKLILIYHRLRDVPELYLDKNVTIAFINKLNKYTALIKSDLLYPLIGESTLKLINVPRTNIPFKTYGIGDFTLENKKEMEMLDLWYKTMILKKHNYNDEQIKVILKEVSS